MGEAFSLRWASNADYADLADVLYDAVHNGPSRYTEAQRRIWVPERQSGAAWAERLDRQAIIIAEDDTGIVGFMSLADQDYIDFAFIRPKAQGRGVFRLLFAEIVRRARTSGQTRLWVHASLMAQPAFAAVGFVIIEQQTIAIGDVALDRFEMELAIHSRRAS